MVNLTDLTDGENSTHVGHTVGALTESAKNLLEISINNFIAELGSQNSDNSVGAHNMDHMNMGDNMPMMHGMMMGHKSPMAQHHMMKMWFHGGYNEVILFDFWRIESLHGLLLSCLLIFVMSAMYEGIKWFRVCLQIAADKARLQSCRVERVESHKGLLEDGHQNGVVYTPKTTANNNQPCSFPCFWRWYGGENSAFAFRHVIQGLLYALQLTLAYWMMLIAMTYNSYLTAAVILGAAVGHWLFAVLRCFSFHADHLDSLATDACH